MNKDKKELVQLAGCVDCALARVKRVVRGPDGEAVKVAGHIMFEVIEEKCNWGGLVAVAAGDSTPFRCKR